MMSLFRTLAILSLLVCTARADIGLMLEESTGQGMSRWTSAGHSAVYLSRVCPDTAVRLRLCEAGEQGSVLTNYVNFNQDKPYAWNAVPLSIFLYGVEDANNRPLFATPELRTALQERYRMAHLRELCPEGPCTDPKAHWRDTVAALFVRDIYMFEATTTLEQDLAFIQKFNSLPNVDRYNGFTNNCADFARLVINSYFPGAARADHVNDFGMTSPKAISKSFTHYAVKHPDLQFHVVRFTQVPGTYRRSSSARKGTEVAFTSKKWFFPMLLRSNELLLFAASYIVTGRFNPERELRRRPTHEVTTSLQALHTARDHEPATELKARIARDRAAIFGTKDDWDQYAAALHEFQGEAASRDLEFESKDLKSLLATLQERGSIVLDSQGLPWLEYHDSQGTRRVGISAGNVNLPASDGELAYSLLLARTSAKLATSPGNRELLPNFQQDWQLLLDARRHLDWKILTRQFQINNPPPLPDASESATPVGFLLP